MVTERPDYGVDAPGVIRNLAGIGVASLAVAGFAPTVFRARLAQRAVRKTCILSGAICLTEAALMLLYAKKGKFFHCERMLSRINWRGDERVLDIGTGGGLLLIAAAKRLMNGSAVGIDIWRTGDLSDNGRTRIERNIDLAGLRHLCEVREADAQKLPFPDESFDVVLSNLCIHNIESSSGRDQACREIARVLRPGGTAIVSDFKNTGAYTKVFRETGLGVKRSRMALFTTFPPLRNLEAHKPE